MLETFVQKLFPYKLIISPAAAYEVISEKRDNTPLVESPPGYSKIFINEKNLLKYLKKANVMMSTQIDKTTYIGIQDVVSGTIGQFEIDIPAQYKKHFIIFSSCKKQ